MLGSIRRECLDHVIVLDERHLRRILRKYVDYYHSCRTHLSLEKDAPEPRRVESPAMGKVRAIPKVAWSPSSLHSTRCLSPICSGRLLDFAPAYTCAFYLFIRQPMGRKSALRREIPWILRGFQGRLSR